MSLSRRTVLSTAAVGIATVAAANAQTPNTPAGTPQPTRPGRGGTDPGARNIPVELQNPDIFVPPATDHGTVPNLKFPFSASHIRLERGGWTRQVTERELGISKEIAGVDMRLNTGGVRELHWHKAAEWAYMLYGRARITAVDEEAASSSTMSASTSGTFPRAFRTRSRGSAPTAASSCWCLTTAASPRTTPSCSATGSSTCRPRCWARISACRH